jgi:hypothetical protein
MASLTSFRPCCGPGLDSASDRNLYHEYFLGGKGGRCIDMINLPSSCADYREIWKLHCLWRDCVAYITVFPLFYTNLHLPVALNQNKGANDWNFQKKQCCSSNREHFGGGGDVLSFLQFSEVRKEEQNRWFIKEELLRPIHT